MGTNAAGLTVTRHVGPHPSFVKVAQPYMLEQQIRDLLAETGVTEAKEDAMRLQGVAYLDNVRKHLMLCAFYGLDNPRMRYTDTSLQTSPHLQHGRHLLPQVPYHSC